MEPQELARWTRFAAKGGIGKCTASRDCVAQNPEDLMFLQDDEIVVLRQISVPDNLYLGFCEGVVGKFSGADVQFHGKLKKPVFTRRPGSVTANSTASPALSGRPIVSSPTPSEQSSSPFHLDKSDQDGEYYTGPSEQSHSHGGISSGHAPSSQSNTRPSTADKAHQLSEFSRVDTPSRPSDDQSRPLAIEVVDERGQPSHQVNQILREFREEARVESPVSDSFSPFTSEERVVRSVNTRPGPVHRAQDSIVSNTAQLRSTSNDESVPSPTQPPNPEPTSRDDEEAASPTSEYTREDNHLVSEDSHLQRVSTMTHSDGGFGIGLSLLQGLAAGDTDSRYWSESEADTDAPVRKPVATLQEPHASTSQQKTPSIHHAPHLSQTSSSASMLQKGSLRSESDAGDDGAQYNDDDIFDDYRYSRYSVVSTGRSRQSTMASIKAPPLPDDSRPSLDGQMSIRSAPSPPPTSLLTPKPLNIVKNSTRVPSPMETPTTPMARVHSPDTETTPSSVSPAPGMTSALRERGDEDHGKMLAAMAKLDLTPKPSVTSFNIQAISTDTMQSATSNDYNGDESTSEVESPETEEPTDINGPLSPASTYESGASLFLPHPGAPKPMMSNGQIEARPAAIHVANAKARMSMNLPNSPEATQTTPTPPVPQNETNIPPSMSLHSTLAMAAAKARNVRQTTLYGATQVDLLSSPVPVPIAFSLDNPPPSPRGFPTPELGFPRPPSAPKLSSPASPVGLGINSPPRADADPGKAAAALPIPRANFFPKSGAPRPRSRSFSGFDLSNTDPLIPVERSREEGSQPRAGPDYRASLRGTSPSQGRAQTSPSSSQPSRSMSPSRGPSRSQRPTHVPSPLSLPAISNTDKEPEVTRNAPPSPNTTRGSLKGKGLRQVASSGVLRSASSAANYEGGSKAEPRVSNEKRESSPTKPSPTRRSTSTNPIATEDADRSELTTPSLVHTGASSSASSPMGRSASLRSKLSVSALRAKGSNGRPSRDGGDAPVPYTSPVTPGTADEEERVQVKDMEFELVKPVLKTTGLRGSEDGLHPNVMSPEVESIRSGFEGSGSAWRADSPSASPGGSHLRSPNVRAGSSDSLGNPRGPSAIQAASIEAHRLREQKWMSLISSTPSSQAKKSKKVKRLLLEGVPSSVRGRVWGLVTDSKARRMEGIFSQLVKKAPKHLVPVIEQDVDRCFPDHPHLRDPRGSLANLLLAYTAMVPDIRYRTGLTRIAGNLLLQAPDEDAFWIFVALMDSHLRGYYATVSTGQFEIDASLFQNLVESVEPELANQLFNELRLRSVDICGTWFCCLFAGIIPPDHLHRVWDILFYEGSIYLFRVGLALMTLCKRPLMTLNAAQGGQGAAIELLSRPPLSIIPQDPDSFISHTFIVKVRDDDLRKQRAKREAQWKKDRLAQR